ncbi:hypothetical protein TRIUR3_32739 [Triticum urartu]|uniref:Uncharacterized protein n=1 Tax=Triticum urartu TaxID=4572 RepID=M7ZBA4_TRIUA|nr:hypothetical protein TRIUR3_32739 [Triticum urartu]
MGGVRVESWGVGDEENGVGFMMEGDTTAKNVEVGCYMEAHGEHHTQMFLLASYLFPAALISPYDSIMPQATL